MFNSSFLIGALGASCAWNKCYLCARIIPGCLPILPILRLNYIPITASGGPNPLKDAHSFHLLNLPLDSLWSYSESGRQLFYSN